jgi:predicted dehydrogenase
MAAPVLRWGVLGSGWIADRFIGSLQRHTRQQILAVGSRDAGRSVAFAARHGVPRSYGAYAALVADPDIDVVYVATPHTEHLPCARLALEAGKPVLVEKPIGLNAAQALEIARLAASQRLFCMEACCLDSAVGDVRRGGKGPDRAASWLSLRLSAG